MKYDYVYILYYIYHALTSRIWVNGGELDLLNEDNNLKIILQHFNVNYISHLSGFSLFGLKNQVKIIFFNEHLRKPYSRLFLLHNNLDLLLNRLSWLFTVLFLAHFLNELDFKISKLKNSVRILFTSPYLFSNCLSRSFVPSSSSVCMRISYNL
jgi:hypothetical protein